MLAEAEVEVKAREMDEKLKRLKKKVESSSESEEEVRPRRVEPEPVFETVSASRSQIQHELQMTRRKMAMRAMFQAPALWINEPLDPAGHGNETQVWSQVSPRSNQESQDDLEEGTRPSVEPRESFRSSRPISFKSTLLPVPRTAVQARETVFRSCRLPQGSC